MILSQYNYVPTSVRNCLLPEGGVLGITIVDFISIIVLVGFILLHASYYYNRKGPVFYVYLVYNQYIYVELSIYVLFILSQDTPAEVNCHFWCFCQIEVSFINFPNKTRICAVFVFSVTIFLYSKRITYLFYWVFKAKNHP